MKKIKLFLSYNCYPMWIYEEDGELLKNDIADELNDQLYIKQQLDLIQLAYNNLFINNVTVYKYIGYSDVLEKADFQKRVDDIVELIHLKLSQNYTIENKIII
jgi:tRNA A37 N6-isopentenylltransferase MiaA